MSAEVVGNRPHEKKSWENTLAFINEASAVDVERKGVFPKGRRRVSRAEFIRGCEIFGMYAGTSKTVDEIAKEYKISRNRIPQIFVSRLNQMYLGVSRDLRKKYPYDSFQLTRATAEVRAASAVKTKLRRYAPIVERVKQQATIKELKKEFGGPELIKARASLAGTGIEVPYEFQRVAVRFAELLDSNVGDSRKQELLNEIKHNEYKALMKSKNEYIIPLSRVAQEAGVGNHKQTRIVYDFVKSKEIPASTFSVTLNKNNKQYVVNNYFIAVTDKNRVQELLREDPDMDRLRNQKIKSELPMIHSS